MQRNVYFELTRAFNAAGPTAALASGQAVVYYRVAIMSKDGDERIVALADATLPRRVTEDADDDAQSG